MSEPPLRDSNVLPARCKVFGVGLSKTGTTSLNKALEILGYRTIHYPPLTSIPDLFKSFDAGTDTPVACSFEELDSHYPNSKFILTLRDEASWLRSAELHFADRVVKEPWKRELRHRLYGGVTWDPARFLRAYRQHNQRVLRYFLDRPGDLLVMNIVAGDGWESLCAFLGVEVPCVPFPRENASIAGAAGKRAVEQAEPKSYARDNLDFKLRTFCDFDNGFFVEAGANDGIARSNTLYFEKYLGWRGLLIEAVPELARVCAANRPACVVESAALVSATYTGATVPMRYCNLMSVVEGAMTNAEEMEEHIARGRRLRQVESFRWKSRPGH